MPTRLKSVAVAASGLATIGAAHAQCTPQWLPVLPNGAITQKQPPMSVLGSDLVVGQIITPLRWGGTAWTSMGAPGNVVTALTNYNGELYAGSLRVGFSSLIYRWNGTAWKSLTPFATVSESKVLVFSEYQGKLLVAGSLKNSSGRNALWLWDGVAWSSPGFDSVTASAPITSVAVYHGEIYAYGADQQLAADAASGNVLRFDGTVWKKVGPSGLKAGGTPLLAMCVYQDKLIIGSQFVQTAAGVNLGPLVSFDGTTVTSIPVSAARIQSIASMTEYHGDLIIGGDFNSTFGVAANGIVRWNGTTFSTMGQGFLPGTVATMQVYRDELYVGLGSTWAGGDPHTVFARWSDAPTAWVAQQPVSRPVNKGLSLTVAAAAASGFTGVSYQWKHNGANVSNGPGGASPGGGTVSGASGPIAGTSNGSPVTLTIAGVQASDAGEYTIVFTTSTCGTSESTPATITVNTCPSDLNGDGFVDDADFNLFVAAYDRLLCTASGMPPWCPSDFNGDNLVDDADFVLFAAAYSRIVCE